ncbi:MAG: hypothetical protein NWQ19_05755 [Nonlabens sp.]|nr:hypothetical protein [Nonlabens sp.]
MDNVFMYVVIGLAIGLAVIFLLEEFARSDARRATQGLKRSVQDQLAAISKFREVYQPQDVVRTRTNDWIFDYVTSKPTFSLKELEQLVLKIQDYYKTTYNSETNFTTDFPVRQDIPLTAVEALHMLLFTDACVHNATVHAHARFVFVIASLQDEELSLIVHDNGIGYDVSQSVSKTGAEHSYRAAKELKASLKLTSTAGNGTIANMILPKPSREIVKLKK